MKYKEGQSVHVRISGLIIAGTIKKVEKGGDYIIQFEGGTEKSVNEKLIKPVGENVDIPPKPDSRSLGRRSPSRRSPARTTRKGSPSPSRRSPGRTRTKTPASPPATRRSPGRSKKSSPSPSRSRVPLVQPINSPTRVLKVSLENIDASGDYPSLNTIRKRKPVEHVPDTFKSPEKLETVTHNKIIESELFSTSVTDDFYTNNDNVYLKSRNRNFEENLLNDIGKLSDDDEIISEIKLPAREGQSEPRTLLPPREFGGWLGALFSILLIPSSVIALHVLCSKDSCSFKSLPNLKEYKSWKNYFDATALATYVGYLTLLSLLSLIPYVGQRLNSLPSKEKIYTYRMNGLFSAFILLVILIILETRNISAVNFLLEKYFQLLISSLTVGFIISVLLFIKSKFVSVSLLNPYGSTYNFIYDFFLGRQINPRVLKIDVKMILLRASYIAALIYNSIYLFKSLNVSLTSDHILSLSNITLNPLLLTCAILQIVYVLDLLLFESHLITTFELQYEGLGYMKVMLYAAYPFYLTASTKYLYEYNIEVERNILLLSAICMVYSAGYLMYRGSNSQKNAFRLNPYDPALKHLESMPTGQGKKLIISGWWGRLKHPNYSGDILMHLSIGALCAGSIASLAILPPILMLAIRAVRDSRRCHRRYGTAWDRYSQKVRYSIVPRVF